MYQQLFRIQECYKIPVQIQTICKIKKEKEKKHHLNARNTFNLMDRQLIKLFNICVALFGVGMLLLLLPFCCYCCC